MGCLGWAEDTEPERAGAWGAASAPGLMPRAALQLLVSALASRRALVPFARRCDLGHPRSSRG